MKQKIAILGSTGSIGNNLLKIIKKNPKDFNIILLTANKNYKKLLSQAKKFNVKNLILNDVTAYNKAAIILKNNKKVKLFRDFKSKSATHQYMFLYVCIHCMDRFSEKIRKTA